MTDIQAQTTSSLDIALLPREIRNRIYYYLVVHTKPLGFEVIDGTEEPPKSVKRRRAWEIKRRIGMPWSSPTNGIFRLSSISLDELPLDLQLGTTNLKFRPQTSPLDKLPLELQRLLYSSNVVNAPMIAELRRSTYSSWRTPSKFGVLAKFYLKALICISMILQEHLSQKSGFEKSAS